MGTKTGFPGLSFEVVLTKLLWEITERMVNSLFPWVFLDLPTFMQTTIASCRTSVFPIYMNTIYFCVQSVHPRIDFQTLILKVCWVLTTPILCELCTCRLMNAGSTCELVRLPRLCCCVLLIFSIFDFYFVYIFNLIFNFFFLTSKETDLEVQCFIPVACSGWCEWPPKPGSDHSATLPGTLGNTLSPGVTGTV